MNWWQRIFGNTSSTSQQPSSREQREELEEQLKLKRLQRASKIMEAYTGDYWLNGYADILARYQDGGVLSYPISQPTDRRYGSNFPFWVSEQQLSIIRAQARMVTTMNPNAQGLLNGLCSYVIGSGFSYKAVPKPTAEISDSVIDAVGNIIKEFCEDNSWSEMEQELFWRSREDGEAFLRLFPQASGRLHVRTVEPEQIFQPPGSDLPHFSYGIETDPDDVFDIKGYFVSYIAPAGKQESDGAFLGERVDADEMLHIKCNVKRAIKRGLSDFSYDTLDAFMVASKLRANMGEGAAVQAAIAGIRQHESSSAAQVETFVQSQIDYSTYSPVTLKETDYQTLKSGSFLDIPKGMNYVPPPGAQNAAAHLEVFQSLLRSAGNRHNAPEWLVSSNASNNNYSSSLTAESPFLRNCVRLQKFYERPFRRVILSAIETAAKAGRLPLNILELIDIQVTAPSVETRDKAMEAQANQVYSTLGIKSPQTIAHEIGLDWDTELVNQQEARQELGVASQLPTNPDSLPPEEDGMPASTDVSLQNNSQDIADKVSDTSLNGAQVASLVDLVIQAQSGQLPVASALAVAQASFPSVNQHTINAIFAGIGGKIVDSTDKQEDESVTEADGGKYGHINFTPPKGAREAAKRALEVRAEKPESQRGMTPVGIARARDLANGSKLSPETVRRMKAFFDRHIKDKQGSTWDEQGKGWQAWMGWGGDPGYSWAKKIVKQMDAADIQEWNRPIYTVNEGQWVTMGAKSKSGGGEKKGGVPVYIDDAGNISKGPSHMVGKKPSDIGDKVVNSKDNSMAVNRNPTASSQIQADPEKKPEDKKKDDIGIQKKDSLSSMKEAGFGVDDSIAKADDSVTSALHNSLSKLKQDFPGIERYISSIRHASLPEDTPLTFRVESGIGELLVDTDKLGSSKISKSLKDTLKSQSSGFLASRGGISGIIEHELAHAIDKAPFSIQQNWKGIASAKKYLRQNPPSAKDLSRYAMKSGPNQKEEIWAEAFASWRTNTSPTKWQQGFNNAISGK